MKITHLLVQGRKLVICFYLQSLESAVFVRAAEF